MEIAREYIKKEFIAELEKYFAGGGESSLSGAYELGRRAIEGGMGELEIVNIYYDSLRYLVNSRDDGDQLSHSPLAVNFITECLAPFEMRQMAFKELILNLDQKNSRLEEEVNRRKETETELSRSRKYFQHLIENALDIITILNFDGTIRFESPSVERILGYTPEEMKGKKILDYVHPGDQELLSIKIGKLIEHNNAIDSVTYRFKHKDGTWRHIDSFARNLSDIGDEPGLLVNSRDVTDRISNQIKLERSKKQLAKAQEIGRVGSWEWSVKDDSIYWSKQLCNIYGVSREEYPRTLDDYMAMLHPDDREIARKIITESFSKRKNFAFEHRIVLPDGSTRILFGRGEVINDENGNPINMIGTGQDITRIKKSEEKLREYGDQLKKLAERREKTREEERIRIARELHDELGQMLTVLKMDISTTISKSRIKYGEKVTSEIDEELELISGRIDSIVKSVQRITSELRPEVLDNLDLHEALEWQIQEFKKATGMQVLFDNNVSSLENVGSDQATVLYRVLQEALTNIMRHAQATKINICLKIQNSSALLIIQDNGKGVSRDIIRKSNSLGLIGMRERCLALGGRFSIDGESGEGTIVSVEIPLENSKRKNMKK